jgi:hypothetical protein
MIIVKIELSLLSFLFLLLVVLKKISSSFNMHVSVNDYTPVKFEWFRIEHNQQNQHLQSLDYSQTLNPLGEFF